jgi:hypothetical protein
MTATGTDWNWIGTLAPALFLVGMPALASTSQEGAPEAIAFFETRIRPVLAEQCLSCHGSKTQNSGLRLDSREAILEGGFIEGPGVYLDDPAGSPLLLAVRHEIDIKMPPEGKLAEEQIADLERWVSLGIPWPDDATIHTPEDAADLADQHWAFKSVGNPEPPEVSDPARISSPIDAFILARLDEQGISPSPRADRRTLLRRVTFDLIGLPPTPDEIDDFLSDPRPDEQAFAEVVDRLLASPHYGERWGRHWLDVARYADTKGYVFTEERRYPYAYTYRDYVVRSFNEDKPFDRFILEQIAADSLDLPEGDASLAAMGFLTVGQRFLNSKNDIIDDRIDVVSRGLMGLTVSCARCHDHKYDPIPTADYYALFGVFDSSTEPESLPLINEMADAGGPDREDFLRQFRERQAKVEEFVRSKRDEMNADLRNRFPRYLDGALAIDFNVRGGSLDAKARERELSTKRLGAFTEKWQDLLEQSKGGHDPIFSPWHALAALPAEQFAEEAAEMIVDLGGDDESPLNPMVARALTEPAPPATFPEAVARYGEAFSAALGAGEDEPGRAELVALLDGPLCVSEEHTTRLFERDERNSERELTRKVDELQVSHPGAPPRAMVMVDNETPSEPVIFLRGNPGNRGPQVPRQFLKLIEGEERQPFADGSGRLELARKIADPENPLTSRVMVNRIWMHHFGRPIVGTPSDFGTRSDPPSHPELLDFLARQFVESGWSIKAMHRLILNSNTYRQSSLDRSEAVAVDPENLLLWRQNRRRLELEPMRDAMLSVAGRLDPSFGGRPRPSPSDPGGTRRTLYSMIDRTFLDGVFRTFDFGSTEVSNPSRPTTIVPQQALFLMNSPFVAEQARHLAQRSDEGSGSDDPETRIRWLYRTLLGRPPESIELEVGLRFLSSPLGGSEVPESPWRIGFGGFDESSERVVGYQDFPHWTGDAWQFGPEYPHPEGQYLRLQAEGGHVGHGPDRAAIRRWVAPRDGTVRIEGKIAHNSAEGDGVRARVVAGNGGLLGEWTAHDGRARTVVGPYEVEEGDTIDFVVDCVGTPAHDSFRWAPTVQLEASDGSVARWDARTDFAGPPPPPLTAEEQYAQALLMTNEFLYID